MQRTETKQEQGTQQKLDFTMALGVYN